MLFKALTAAAALVGSVAAQRPSNISICDYYTTALLTNNTAANQKLVLTLVVNTAVIGSYQKPTIPGITFPNITVPGILAPGVVNNVNVNLLPYFNGSLASSNRNGMSGVAINFLDGGGAAALMNNTAATSTSSNQYRLLTHLYEYFGALLGCSAMGGSDYPAYDGGVSQYNVHKFMNLNTAQNTYFINQVALSAKSFGVADSDLAIVGAALNSIFNVRCAQPVAVIPAQGAQLQSICIDSTCQLASNSSCGLYASNITAPSAATTTVDGGASQTSPAGGAATTTRASSGNTVGFSLAAVFAAALAFVL